LNPLIERTAERIAGEVELRAQIRGEDSAEALRRLNAEVQSLELFVQQRRKFLLSQNEIANAEAFDRTRLK
jgi:hypothetical protein